jgi:hypothetical protein
LKVLAEQSTPEGMVTEVVCPEAQVKDARPADWLTRGATMLIRAAAKIRGHSSNV